MKTGRFTVGVDFHSAVQSGKSGVGYYTKGMVEALAKGYPDIDIYVHYYNFLNRSKVVIPNLANIHPVKSTLLHPKIVNALRRISLEIPFELLLKRRCDAYFFPNFANLPVSKNTSVITTIHDLAYLEIPESVSARNRDDLVRYVPRYIKRSSKIATVSNNAKSRIKHFYSDSPEIFVTYSPPSHLRSGGPRGNRKDTEKNHVLFVGNLEPRKNLDRLLDAYEKLDSRLQKRYPLVIVGGNGWNNLDIKQKIQKLKKRGLKIITPGYVSGDELVRIYEQASVFVFPSLYEGYGIPPLEAMSFGVPVLASDIPVLKEVCGNAALYCDAYSADSIANNLAVILTDQKLRKRLQRSGRERVQQYTWEKAANILYENITA